MKIKYQCDYCQKTAYSKPSDYEKKDRHFCSQTCYSMFRRAAKGIDLCGYRFGMLKVLEESAPQIYSRLPGQGGGTCRKFLCECDCGKRKVISMKALRSGATTSCGCRIGKVASERQLRHGHARHGRVTRTYKTWLGMKDRCNNPNNRAYGNYGGRGITVCERWRGENGFENFLEDMGTKPKGLSLDRIDNNGNYEPGNCRWATSKQQARNYRRNHNITFRGQTKTLREWSEETGINYGTLSKRIRNWPIEKALTHPAREARP